MRRVTRFREPDDRGAVLVWAATSLAMLLGVGAIVIDAGALFQERRELQNGADAAALAVAKDCAEGDCLDAVATAEHYASENAKDRTSDVSTVCGQGVGLIGCPPPPEAEGASGWVRVDTSTLKPGGGTRIEFLLAPFLDVANVGQTVEASAVAAWGAPRAASTIPLTFSQCEYETAGGRLFDDPPVFPDGEITIYLHTSEFPEDCLAGPSGGDLPGGFGWLANDDDCVVEIAAGADTVGVDTGNDAPCDPTVWQDVDVVLPIFDSYDGTGANGQYHIAGFVGFHVTGYRFPRYTWPTQPTRFDCELAPGGSGACIRGYFTEVTIPDGEFGGGTDFGARVVKMIG
ncbi:MAG TPA: pilus assembly protein TadG-related protein [Jiangellaceae bacterium]